MSTLDRTISERVRGRSRSATIDVAPDPRVDRARSKGSVRRRESISRRVLGLADALAVSCALVVGAVVVGHGQLTLASIAVPPLFVVLAKTLGLYDRDEHLLHKTTLDETPALVGLATLSALLLWLSGDLLINGALGRVEVLATWATLLLADIAFRSVARSIARELAPVERCLLVGDAVTAAELRAKLVGNGSVKALLVDWIPVGSDGMPEGEEDIAERLRGATEAAGVDRVILGPVPGRSEELLDAIRQVGYRRLRVSVLPDVARVVDSTVELDRLDGITLLGLRRFEMTRSSLLIKRTFDIVGSALALALLSPFLVAIAVAIKLDSPGSILYRQRRAGRHGEPFRMLKFRSMVDGADRMQEGLLHLNEAEGVFKIADDPRITRAGNWLRRLHLDELPQLVNVLRGEMSLVGPRPLPLEEDGRLEGWHRRRLDLRPGITGVWQVLGSSRIPVREMVRIDYQYVANWSLWNDVRILLLTVPRVVRRRGL
jgi:exopolysaccharide biosynthesis polyprenyl glycosylphosphotransferase